MEGTKPEPSLADLMAEIERLRNTVNSLSAENEALRAEVSSHKARETSAQKKAMSVDIELRKFMQLQPVRLRVSKFVREPESPSVNRKAVIRENYHMKKSSSGSNVSDLNQTNASPTNQGNLVVRYHIEVERGRTSYTISRRFNDFRTLHTTLVREFPGTLPLLPDRHIFIRTNNSDMSLTKRKRDLEVYLQQLAGVEKIRDCATFLQFISPRDSDGDDADALLMASGQNLSGNYQIVRLTRSSSEHSAPTVDRKRPPSSQMPNTARDRPATEKELFQHSKPGATR